VKGIPRTIDYLIKSSEFGDELVRELRLDNREVADMEVEQLQRISAIVQQLSEILPVKQFEKSLPLRFNDLSDQITAAPQLTASRYSPICLAFPLKMSFKAKLPILIRPIKKRGDCDRSQVEASLERTRFDCRTAAGTFTSENIDRN
jgi:hypothetical protein